MRVFSCVGLAFLAVTTAQQVGSNTPENHPSMPIKQCTKSGGCSSENGAVVLDSNWRWLHQTGTTKNCYTGNEWDKTICPDPKTCTQNCALEGGDYPGTYGINVESGNAKLGFVTQGSYSKNIGSRTYLLDGDSGNYKMFKLKNREFSFDVDVSKLPCGINGALYLVEMPEDGGSSEYPTNRAGAKYGTGYCDAQCPHDLKFIDGEANMLDWTPSPTDKNAGTGMYGTCCTEMDIWEANQISTAVTPHVCTVKGRYRCNGTECGDNAKGERYDGVCDKDGCDFNPYRMGDKTFYGNSSAFQVDTSRPFTVTTQWVTTDGTDNGDLQEIRRLFVQDGKVIKYPSITVNGNSYSGVTDGFCSDQKKAFGDENDFEKKGGLKQMGEALDRGMVLVMSIWDDHAVNMLWLDSDYPLNKPATAPGVARGSCSTSSGKPDEVESTYPNAYVQYGNIKYGEIGSTIPSGPPGPSPGPSPSGCPGGSLSACINLCPSNPPAAYKACVQSCVSRCPSTPLKLN